MNYLDIQHCNMVNGSGLRTVIWVSGCERKCKNCFQPHTHDIKAGIKFDKKAKEELFKDNYTEWCDGITLLGGEPLHPMNRQEIISLAKETKEKFPNKTIWLYTGYTLEEIQQDSSMADILKYIDVLIDGPYVDELKDLDIPYRGSSNQRLLRKGGDF